MRLLISICILASSFYLHGQRKQIDVYEQYNIKRNPARLFLNRFSFTLTPGYSRTYFKHDLDGFYLLQDQTGQYIFPNSVDINGLTSARGYSDWLNDPVLGPDVPLQDAILVPDPALGNPVGNPLLMANPLLVDGDSVELRFRGVSEGIPITLQVHYNFLEKFRAGIGYTYEKQYLAPLEPVSMENIVRPYQPNVASTSYSRWFVTGGYTFYEWNPYSFVVEGQFGLIRANRKQFNRSLVNHSVFGNIGVGIEQRLSEYFRIIYKTSLDLKGYRVQLPDSTRAEIRHGQPALFFQVGVSINIPEIPRSPISNDHTQVKHVIRNPETGELREYRGQPIWKEQNPKVGQNHRKLFRFKWFNRRKMHPY